MKDFLVGLAALGVWLWTFHHWGEKVISGIFDERETRICFNAQFDEYYQCKWWANEQLNAGHSEEELKAEVDGAEKEDKEAMDCASYPNQYGCSRSA